MSQQRDNTGAYRSSAKRKWRLISLVALVILVLPVLLISFLIVRFDPNRYAPAIIAAVDQATGRQFTIGGPITMRLSLTPMVEASDLSLSNPPDFADPAFLTFDRVEAKISLLPLLSHRLDILQLVLVHPKIVLEPSRKGKTDWDFAAARPAGSSPARSDPDASGRPIGYKIALQALEVQDGVLIFKGSKAPPVTINIPKLTGTADSLTSPLHLNANAVVGEIPFSVAGVVGPISRFSGIGNSPWPVDLSVKLGDATASVRGVLSHPRIARGYDLHVQIAIPALETFANDLPSALFHGQSLPPLHDVNVTARIVDQNSLIPAIDDLSIKIGKSDLSSIRPGLSLNAIDIEMASLDRALSVDASGQTGVNALNFMGNFGPPQALLNPALLPSTMPPQGSYPVSVKVQIGATEIVVTGAIATPQALAGVALAVNATIPDLSVLSSLVGKNLPDWKNITVQTALVDPGGLGIRNAVGLDGLAVAMDNADFGGATSLYFGTQPRLQLALKFSQVNVDALLAAVPPSNSTIAIPSVPQASSTKIIPDTTLPLKLLKTASADVQVSADSLVWNQATYTALQGHAVLAGGVLTLDPITAQLPGGSVSVSSSVDVTKEPAIESVKINAPALALSPFLKAFGLSQTAEGTFQAQISANSAGDSLQAIMGSLNGQLGLAMVNGIVDGAIMDTLFGVVLRTVGLPADLAGAHGPVAVRCMGLRVDAVNGIGTIRTLTLDSNRLLLQGGGSIDFGNETFNVILRPQMSVANTDISIPVAINGSFQAPTTSVAPAGALQEVAKTAVGLPAGLAQQVLGNNSALGKAARMINIGDVGDVCPAALSLGRLGQPGPAASALPASNGGAAAKAASGPTNLLNALFGK